LNRYAPRGPAPSPAAARYLLIGLLIGAGLGGVGGFFAYPFVAARNSGQTAGAAVDQGGVLRAAGRFTQADPADRIRYGSGALSVYDNRVELGEDFAVGPGPKYHLYLVPQRGIDPDTRVEETMFVDLGPLKSFSGAQTYAIPAGVAVGDYASAVVWCEQFNTLISPAPLNAAQ